MPEKHNADTVFVSCTSIRIAAAIPELEARFGIPITSSNHAMGWHCLRLAGIDDLLLEHGKLFGLPLKDKRTHLMSYETILRRGRPVGDHAQSPGRRQHVQCDHVSRYVTASSNAGRNQYPVLLTGAGDRFFCIGGRKDGLPDTQMYPGILPTLEMYEAIDRVQKPVIASVNGFAVGGGNVLQMVCDLTIAMSAIFRQVGPMMGSFDAGYGPYLEDLLARRKPRRCGTAIRRLRVDFGPGASIGLLRMQIWPLRRSLRSKWLTVAASRSRPSKARSTHAMAA